MFAPSGVLGRAEATRDMLARSAVPDTRWPRRNKVPRVHSSLLSHPALFIHARWFSHIVAESSFRRVTRCRTRAEGEGGNKRETETSVRLRRERRRGRRDRCRQGESY